MKNEGLYVEFILSVDLGMVYLVEVIGLWMGR